MRLLALPLAALALAACSSPGPAPDSTDATSLPSSGWLSTDSFEVGAELSSRIEVDLATAGTLATDRARQEALVDTQVRFAKNALRKQGYHLNQLVEKITALEAKTEGGVLTIAYTARVDVIRQWKPDVALPTLAELTPQTVQVKLPKDPRGTYATYGDACAEPDAGSTVYELNHYYYFAPDKPGCAIPVVATDVVMKEVYARTNAFPEYDRLLRRIEGVPEAPEGSVGLRAALMPSIDSVGRHKEHKALFEKELGLKSTSIEEGKIDRYVWTQDGVTLVFDLYDPAKQSVTTTFPTAMRDYDLVYFAGHSEYGSLDYLRDPSKYSPRYQIFMFHSCRSQQYYSRLILRGKATKEDPSGGAAVDFVATGDSAWDTDALVTLPVLLRGLQSGMAAAAAGRNADATSWMAMAADMNRKATADVIYGMAGVRENAWPNVEAPAGALSSSPAGSTGAGEGTTAAAGGTGVGGGSGAGYDGYDGGYGDDGSGGDAGYEASGAGGSSGVPAAWTCDPAWYGDGYCDCACGDVDVDCAPDACGG